MKTKISCLFTWVMVLSACTPAQAVTTTVADATPLPTSSTDMPRWVFYQRGLSDILLGPPGRTQADFSKDHGICEWEIFGQKENEVYVWAICQKEFLGTATSAPAIVRLDRNGNIAEIVMPEEGNRNIRELFPADVLERMNSFDTDTAWGHLDKRFADPSIVPLIVEQGVTLP